MRFGEDPLGQRLGETGLAHARFGGNQHHPSVAALRLRPAPEQQLHFLIAADQGCDARTQCLKTALKFSLAQHLPRRHRNRETFEFDRAEVPALEQAADLPPCRHVDHHLIRPRKALQACSEVRGLTDRRLLA